MGEMLYVHTATPRPALINKADMRRKRGCTLSILNGGTQEDCAKDRYVRIML